MDRPTNQSVFFHFFDVNIPLCVVTNWEIINLFLFERKWIKSLASISSVANADIASNKVYSVGNFKTRSNLNPKDCLQSEIL